MDRNDEQDWSTAMQMRLRVICYVNSVWALALLGVFALRASMYPTRLSWLYLGLTVVYLGNSLLAIRGARPSVVLNACGALTVIAWNAPFVLLNVWQFSTGHEMYQDSPGTILIVMINAVLLVIPAAAILSSYLAALWSQNSVGFRKGLKGRRNNQDTLD